MGFSPKEFKALEKGPKLYQLYQLEQKLRDSFFEHTRDSAWMQEAAGPDEIGSQYLEFVHGMSDRRFRL